MNVQEREELDYGDGYANEHQRQFAHECAQRETRSQALIDALNDDKFCVVAAGPDYCPHTDAVMGQKECLCSAHDDRQAAETALAEIDHDPHDEASYYVLPRQNIVLVVTDGQNNVPETDVPF